MNIETKIRGDWSRTITYLKKIPRKDFEALLRHYGELGVKRLSLASPQNTGRLSESWSYTIERNKNTYSLTWHSSDTEDGYNVAVLVQYGHATNHGTFVLGIDFVNPAIQPVLDELRDKIWEEVTKQ